MTTDDRTTEHRITIDWAWRIGPDGDRLGQLFADLDAALADLGVTLRETATRNQVEIVLSRTGDTATCGCDAQADAVPTLDRQEREGNKMDNETEYIIEYTIHRRRPEDDDFSEIGFGSSGAWRDIDMCAHMLSTAIDRGEWETEGDHPDPDDVLREIKKANR